VSRTLAITLEAKQGQIHDFSAIVDGVVRVSGDGTQKRTWAGEIPVGKVKVTIWTTGVPGSQFQLTVDLPGKADDFAVKYTLSSTMHKVEFET
jgi:hypothetical protein